MAGIRLYSAAISRRGVLKSAAAAAALAGVPEAAMAKKKRAQADVGYQDHPHGAERCDNCDPFVPPDKCKTVEGPVSAQGWCNIYSEK
jgi:hypothetical protein